MADVLPKTGTTKTNHVDLPPLQAGKTQTFDPNSIPESDQFTKDSIAAKQADGARADEYDQFERDQIVKKAWKESEAKILTEIAKEGPPKKDETHKNFGPFTDSPHKFVVVCEYLDTHRRGAEITYRELCQFDAIGDRQKGYRTDYSKPLVAETKRRVDQLIADGSIRPLVALR